MTSSIETTEIPARDLFGPTPSRRTDPVNRRLPASELLAARALCRQLRTTRSRPDKQRLAHLICLNLVSMLSRGARQ
jgi:hypothetical protein